MRQATNPGFEFFIVPAVEVQSSFLKKEAEAVGVVEHFIARLIEVGGYSSIDDASYILEGIDLAVGFYFFRVFSPFDEIIIDLYEFEFSSLAVKVSLV